MGLRHLRKGGWVGGGGGICVGVRPVQFIRNLLVYVFLPGVVCLCPGDFAVCVCGVALLMLRERVCGAGVAVVSPVLLAYYVRRACCTGGAGAGTVRVSCCVGGAGMVTASISCGGWCSWERAKGM